LKQQVKCHADVPYKRTSCFFDNELFIPEFESAAEKLKLIGTIYEPNVKTRSKALSSTSTTGKPKAFVYKPELL
jgi:hypothetical protein